MNQYNRWLFGDRCCGNSHSTILPDCDGKDCSCEAIYLELENIKNDIIAISGDTDLSNYYTKAEVDALIPSLSGYATEEWVEDKGYLTDVDLSDYALKSEIPVVPTNVSSFINDAGYLTDVDLSDYALKSEIPVVPTSNSAFTNDMHYVTNAELIQYITNLQQQIDSLQGAVSGCCGETGETTYRWVVMTGENDYLCSGTTKMTKEKKQQSDDGITWTDVVPAEYRMGDTVLEENSEDCGYVPPTPTPTGKTAFFLNYEGDSNIIKTFNENADCSWMDDEYIVWHQPLDGEYKIKTCTNTFNFNEFTGDSTNKINLSISGSTSVIPDGFFADTDLTEGNVMTGCSSIGNYAFSGCSKMKIFSIGLPGGSQNVYRIVNGQPETYMIYCSASTKVQTIGNYAFKNCAALEEFYVLCADVVPTLGTGAFDGCASLRAIIVPSSMLNDFKAAPNWSQYANIIVGF